MLDALAEAVLEGSIPASSLPVGHTVGSRRRRFGEADSNDEGKE